jgi:hypothetical protein
LLVGGVSSALQHAISLDPGWSVVSSGHQHAIPPAADWCSAPIGADFSWCVVLSPSSSASTRPLFRPGDGARQYLSLVGGCSARGLSALGRRPSACGWGRQYLHACSFCCTRPGVGAASTSSFPALAGSRASAHLLTTRHVHPFGCAGRFLSSHGRHRLSQLAAPCVTVHFSLLCSHDQE